MKQRNLATIAAHAASRRNEEDCTPTCAPVHRSVTYSYDRMSTLDAVLVGQRAGYVYSRLGNPTVAAVEEAIAKLESTEAAVACGSGMAAIHLALLGAGVVALNDLLGTGTLAEELPAITVGFLAAAVAGYVCIRWLLHYLQHHSLYIFAAYCTAFSLLTISVALIRG